MQDPTPIGALSILFGSASLTHYGGVYLLHRFFGRLHLQKLLTDATRLIQRNNRYSVGEMLLTLLYPIILGLERIESTRLLRQNEVFQYLTGLRSYPDATTLRRFLLRVAPTALPTLRRLHDRFLSRMTTRPHPPRRLIFDVDSTVLVVYGKQEHARVGYNPDAFGHAATLPQILKKSRIEAYCFLRPQRHEKELPAHLFEWQGADGTRVLGFRILFEYLAPGDDLEPHVRRCAGELERAPHDLMCFYGVGNHGGGPTVKNLEQIRRLHGAGGLPGLTFSTPDRYVDQVAAAGGLPVVTGELQHHARGCYAVHSAVKRDNRRAVAFFIQLLTKPDVACLQKR